ncbi:MAG: serine hydroxymethyltransferase [Eggerthellaceae bacterium]|nr:serine hydroxymethyltransferase [Eggerthellaceae bacterium]
MEYLKAEDPKVADILGQELSRERDSIELIASENFTSIAVMEAMGSVLTNKYAEGYPGKRYYGGCEKVDMVEELAKKRACKLFNCNYANMQPHSGSTANFIAYSALVDIGDTIMGMSLDCGGHLSHGSPVNFSGKFFNIVSYGVNHETETIDYDDMLAIAIDCKPKLLVCGASAYPRIIDFKRIRDICDEVGCLMMVDMAHIAGLIATGAHPSPFPQADIVTSTSHKTLRGPRSGFILANDEEIAAKVDKACFPGSQGGPLMHTIAGKAVAFNEAIKPEFKTYIDNVVENCAAMGQSVVEGGLRLVSGGTDNHLCLVDLTASNTTGKDAEKLLEEVGFTVNKNTIPNEKLSPFVASGIRIGSAAATTRGFNKQDFCLVGKLIAETVNNKEDFAKLGKIKAQVDALMEKHPLYPELVY